MSAGPLAGSAATRIVCARSCALMPVVIPKLRRRIDALRVRGAERIVVALANEREPQLVDALAA